MSDTPLRPGSERRRQLQQQRRAERLRNLWRLLVFSGLATGLGYGLLRQGWILREPSQVEVRGSRLVSRDQVIQAAALRFPQPLLTVQPRQLVGTLSDALPVENVRVTRLMLPPRLRVELVDRSAVARAERRGPAGPERGYVDRLGNWINLRQNLGLRLNAGASSLEVIGWNERHRAPLALVLSRRALFDGRLRQVRFDPNGSLWLTVNGLGPLRLGPADGQLERRLQVAAHLSASLPSRIAGRKPQLVDLSDPDQPELTVSGLGQPRETTPATAVRPQGGQ